MVEFPRSNNNNSHSSYSVGSSGYSSSHRKKDSSEEEGENNASRSNSTMKSFINVDGSHLTDISPLLTCIHTLNESEAIWNKSRSQYLKSLSLKQLRTETDVPREDGFVFAVSLRDGSCLYTSNAIVDHLGYPKDMLVGQCIMNFLFHKDHITFANHLTQGLNACFIQGKRDDSHLVVNTFFCRLRMYQGLRFGYSVSNKKPRYKPFKITLHLNELIVDDLCVEKQAATLCVKASAVQVTSAYSIPEEIPAMTSFSTRHTSSCHFSHVDASAIPYLGYLPQDMIGYSVFDFYHIDDMPQLKDIYELVIKEHGSSFRSKPYRFKVHNGCYILLETEWSCFINPWSHKLEFVVGQHRVLKGPSDVAIFTPCEEEGNTMSEEIVKESRRIEKEIKVLLSQTIQMTSGIRAKRFCNKRKRDLASFVYSCVDEGYGGNQSKGNEKGENTDNKSNSDSDSVVMGDISPYREVNDSSTSSETPPTLQQLRYQENIERFFASQPKTYSDGSDEYNKNEKFSSGEGYRDSSSGSGNGSNKESGNTPKDKSPSTSYGAKVQESSSNSSKCTINLTTGDSGYGKSLEKEGTQCSDQSRAGSSEGAWKKNEDPSEKFSSCLALTEESLSVHNRMNRKHLKQNQRKNKSSTLGSWAPQKSSKHKKSNNVTSIPTQTEVVNLASLEFGHPPCTPSASDPRNAAFLPQMNAACMPSGYVGSSPTPTSFFIPVMYMGSLPYYPPMSTIQPPSGASHWTGKETAASLPSSFVPLMPSYSASGEIIPRYPALGFDPFSGISLGVSSPGPASIRTSTTTTMASGTGQSFKDCLSAPREEKVLDLEQQQPSIKAEVKDTASSYTRSSSFQSDDREEDMELETKIYARAPSTRAELSSEIAFRYQMKLPEVGNVLKKDMEILKSMQQPEFVNRQLQMLRDELEEETAMEAERKRDFRLAESAMLGLLTEEHIDEELEHREDCLLQLMCEDS